MNHNQRIALRIKELRKAAGWTQQDLAEKIGLKQSNVARVEAGTVSPNADTLHKIADALGLRLDFVL